MYTIQTNTKGSRHIDISPAHLETIKQYALLSDLLDSNGIVDESVLDKLRLNVRSLLDRTNGSADLLQLCQDVLFHDNMKAYGLHQLIALYLQWEEKETAKNKTETE